MTDAISVQGLEEQTTETGPHGNSNPYDEHLRVTVGDTVQKIPVTGVRAACYDYHGPVPETIDFDRVIRDGDEVHAETWLPDGTLVELARKSSSYPWNMSHFDDPDETDWDEIWIRPGAEAQLLTGLVKQGLTPAQALDYYMVKMGGGYTATAWAEKRERTHQAVSENVRTAGYRLRITSEFNSTETGFLGRHEYEHKDANDGYVAVTTEYRVIASTDPEIKYVTRYWDGEAELTVAEEGTFYAVKNLQERDSEDKLRDRCLEDHDKRVVYHIREALSYAGLD